MTEKFDTQSQQIKVRKVKNYDAKDIITDNKSSKNVKKAEKHKKEQNPVNAEKQSIAKTETKNSKGTDTKWTKVLIGTVYIFGMFSILYLLSSWWYFLGLIGLAVPILVYFLAKQESVKKASGKVFFVNLCATIVSALFWVLYLTTRHYGIGFMSSIFRALQIAGAVAGLFMVGYYMLEYFTNGKTSVPWLSKMTHKAEDMVKTKETEKVKIK